MNCTPVVLGAVTVAHGHNSYFSVFRSKVWTDIIFHLLLLMKNVEADDMFSQLRTTEQLLDFSLCQKNQFCQSCSAQSSHLPTPVKLYR